MDDVGYNDVELGFGRVTEFSTPTIKGLYSNGVRFTSSYTPPNGGPARAALLSGVYPFSMGLQVSGTL